MNSGEEEEEKEEGGRKADLRWRWSGRREGQRWWQTVAEAAVFLLLPSASLCCFLPLFFVLSVNKVSSSFFVDGGSRWRRRKDRWWFAEGAADSRLLLWFFFSPASTPPLVFFLSVLFCSHVALTSAAPSSVSDDGGAAVVGGAAGRNSGGDGCSSLRWRAVSAAVFSTCAEVSAPSSSRVLQQRRKMVGGCRRLLTSGVAVGAPVRSRGKLLQFFFSPVCFLCKQCSPLFVPSQISPLFFFKLSFLSSCSPLCDYPSLLLQNFAPLRSSLSQKNRPPSPYCWFLLWYL